MSRIKDRPAQRHCIVTSFGERERTNKAVLVSSSDVKKLEVIIFFSFIKKDLAPFSFSSPNSLTLYGDVFDLISLTTPDPDDPKSTQEAVMEN